MKKTILVLGLITSLIFVACNKDDDSNSENGMVQQDPIIGKWQFEKSIENNEEEILTDCEKLSTLEFNEDGTYEGNERHQEIVDGECLEDIYGGKWNNKGNSTYGFLYPEETEDDVYTIEFTDNTFTIISSTTDNGDVINERITYKWVE